MGHRWLESDLVHDNRELAGLVPHGLDVSAPRFACRQNRATIDPRITYSPGFGVASAEIQGYLEIPPAVPILTRPSTGAYRTYTLASIEQVRSRLPPVCL